MSWYQIRGDRVELRLRITTRASRNKIDGVRDERLRILVTAVPEAGKPNEQIIKMLAKSLKIPKSRFTITHGVTHRNKSIVIYESGICSQALDKLAEK